MTTVSFDAAFPDGRPRSRGVVLVALVAGIAGGSTDGRVIGDVARVHLDADGNATAALARNDQLAPAGTFYRCTLVGASPSLVRSIRITSDAAVSWADEAIQVVSPAPPAWVPVEGPRGPAGADGATGEPGPKGDTGDPGPTGPAGSVDSVTGDGVDNTDPRNPVVSGGSFDGTGPALRLGVDTYYSAADQAGRVRWQDQGRSGADAALGVQGMGAVDLDRTVAVGPFASTVDASLWPTSELRCEWSGRLVRQRSDPANEYREVLLVTIDGDDDYVEPAFVVEAGGDVTIGLDCLLSSEAGEVAWRSTPLGDPWGYHDYVMTVDDSGLVSVSIDGVAHASGQLAHVDTSVEAAAPIAFLTPPDGHLIIVSTSGMVMDRVALFDAVSGGATVAEFDVAGSSDGATTVGDWGGSGIVIDDRGPVFLGGGIGDGALIAGTDMLPESCTDGWTIALHARLLSPQLRVLASQHGQALLGGGVAGLTVISAPAFSLPLSAVIGDGTSTAMATMAGAEPTGVVWIVATIDPVNDTLALWVDGEQVASADTSALTAYGNPSDPLGLLPFGALADEVAIWRRPLDPDEIAALSGTGP